MKLLPFLILSLTLLPCSATAANEAPAPQLQTASAMQTALDDALEVYGELASLSADREHLLNPAALRDTAENIATPCMRLRQLPQEQLVQVCLLADAVLWQSVWMANMMNCEEDIEAAATGFEELDSLAAVIRRLLCQAIPDDAREALLQLLAPLGGEKALNLPDKLYNQRMVKDYATVLEFLQVLCAAVNEPDETSAMSQLTDAREALNYLMQSGVIEQLRVRYLTRCFYGSLISGLGSHTYSLPVLPVKLRTEARMQALEPFFTALPELRILLLNKE